MDFDDTWHPATHPSGAVLPSLIALSESLPAHHKKSGLDFLLAFNVGIEVQGRLMRFSNEASNIPKRYNNVSVFGVIQTIKHVTVHDATSLIICSATVFGNAL